MKLQPENESWEDDLRDALGPVPVADFDAWRAKHLETPVEGLVACNNPILSAIRRQVSTTLLRIAAVVAIACSVIWWGTANWIGQSRAFAAQIAGVDAVSQMTWTQIFYVRVTSEDGKRTWIREERSECAYQRPGKYRTTRMDEDGKPRWVTISDVIANRTLQFDTKDQTGSLKPFSEQHDENGPFAWVGEHLRGKRGGTISIVGNRKIDDKEVTDVKWKKSEFGKLQLQHFYFDVSSKQLVGIISMNSGEKFDPEAPTGEMQNPAEEKWSRMEPIGMRVSDIKLDARLDKADFALDAPAEYKIEQIAKQTVTQEEMIEFLAANADFNNQTFPDSLVRSFDVDKYNEESMKARKDRTVAANRLIDICDKIKLREIYASPVAQYLEDHAVPDSFQYVGADVKLGDSSRIVCWFKPKNSSNFRVVYGDLSIEDVKESELPIKLLE